MKQRTKINTDLDTFGQGMTTVEGICSGCGRSIAPEYDKCYACNRYGSKSYAQVRQAKQAIDIVYSVTHPCVKCHAVLSEDSTELHICPTTDLTTPYPMSSFRQTKAATRKSRKASKVTTLTPEQVGMDTFDARKRTFAGF